MGTTARIHIIKQTIGKLTNNLDLTLSVSDEHFCLTLRRGLELSATNSKIKDFESESALIVECLALRTNRDRITTRLPQEDFCQALGVVANQNMTRTEGLLFQ